MATFHSIDDLPALSGRAAGKRVLLRGDLNVPMKDGKVAVDGDVVSIACRECFLREATGWLESEGVQPFACLPMGVSASAMRKRLGVRHRVLGRTWDPDTQTCTINFRILE